jgi:site-specific DNA-methyltransferase (adenine-specific)
MPEPKIMISAGEPRFLRELEKPRAILHYGASAEEVLPTLPAKSVHMVFTSPPYLALRDYKAGEKEIGHERTSVEYVERLVAVFTLVRRVLRADGVLWVNLGDKWINRELQGLPWEFAFALRKSGWKLRHWCPWVKRVAMPEGLRDRPANACETLLMFGHPDGDSYYYDGHSSAVAALEQPSGTRYRRNADWFHESAVRIAAGEQGYIVDEAGPIAACVNPKPFTGAHFAPFPPALVEPALRSATSDGGVCSMCGAPRVRRIERRESDKLDVSKGGDPDRRDGGFRERNHTKSGGTRFAVRNVPTNDWLPQCSCPNALVARPVVLDPFSGSATTGFVALQNGRDYVGIDLSTEYLDVAVSRLDEIADGADKVESALAMFADDQEDGNPANGDEKAVVMAEKTVVVAEKTVVGDEIPSPPTAGDVLAMFGP